MRSDNSGWIDYSHDNWYEVLSQSVGGSVGDQYLEFGDRQNAGLDYVMFRSIISFDTSSFADNAVIIGARIGFHMKTSAGVDTNTVILAYKYPNRFPVDVNDYDRTLFENDGVIYSSVATEDFNGEDLTWMYLNQDGIDYINKTGATIFGFRTIHDVLGGTLSYGPPVYPHSRNWLWYGTGADALKVRLEVWYSGDNMPSDWENENMWYNLTLSLTPDNGPSGTVVNITGSGYTPNENVEIYRYGNGPLPENVWWWAATVQADENGNIDTHDTVLWEHDYLGQVLYAAYDVATTRTSDNVAFTVTSAHTLQIYPDAGPVGTTIHLVGDNFTENGRVILWTWYPMALQHAFYALDADNNGEFDVHFPIPMAWTVGDYAFRAFDNTDNFYSNVVWYHVTAEWENIVPPTDITTGVAQWLEWIIMLFIVIIMTAAGAFVDHRVGGSGVKGALGGCYLGVICSVATGILPWWVFIGATIAEGGIFFLMLNRGGG